MQVDINTSEGSVTNGETQYTHQWNEGDRKVIQDYKQYHWDMYDFFDDLERNGPSSVQPKKPKTDYKFLLQANKEKLKSNKFVGKELHAYLIKNCVTPGVAAYPKFSEVGLISNLESIKDHLISGYKVLRKSNSDTLAASVDYGDWLNVAFELHNNESLAGKQTDSWKQWLETNVGVGDSYGRKLRTISAVLGKYPGFRNLGLPISEVYGRIKEINSLLVTDKSAAEYWQKA